MDRFDLEDKIIDALKECNELISIFVKSVATAQKNKEIQNDYRK